MIPTATPDTTGFIEAQARLREVGGYPVVFRVPVKKKWPEGTKINPITGLPYDALAKQENVEWEEVTKTCLVILKQGSPLRPQSDTLIEPIGEASAMDIILDISHRDYEDVKDAREVVVNSLTYVIREAKPFSLSGRPYRTLVYGEQL